MRTSPLVIVPTAVASETNELVTKPTLTTITPSGVVGSLIDVLGRGRVGEERREHKAEAGGE